MILRFMPILGAVALCGCASTPHVISYYYFPKAQTDITIAQTVSCTANNGVMSVASISAPPSYVTDYSHQYSIDYRSYDGVLRDADTAVTLSQDGRLSAINSTGQGQAVAFVKSAVALAGAFTGIGAAGAAAKAAMLEAKLDAAGNPVPPADKFCDTVRANASKPDTAGGPASVSINFHAKITYLVTQAGVKYEDEGSSFDLRPDAKTPTLLVPHIDIEPDASSADLYRTLIATKEHPWGYFLSISRDETGLSSVCELNGTCRHPVQPQFKPKDHGEGRTPTIMVPDMTMLHLEIWGPSGKLTDAKPAAELVNRRLWEADMLVPEQEPLPIPVTKAALIGGSKTVVSIAESGLITKLEYAKTSGAADLVSSATPIAAQAEGLTDAQQASAIQAKADIVAQQRRLAACEIPGGTCPTK